MTGPSSPRARPAVPVARTTGLPCRALRDWSLRRLDARVATDARLAGRRVRWTRAVP